MLKELKKHLFTYRILLGLLLINMIVVAISSGFTIGMITPVVSAIFGKENASGGQGILRWLIDWIKEGDKMNSLVREC